MKKTMNKQISDKNIDDAFTEYIRYCRVRNLAIATTDYYEECYESFRKSYKGTTISSITEKVFQNYIHYLRTETNLNPISINTRIRGLRTILYHFMKLEYMEDFKIEIMKTPKKIKETYTDAELRILLEKPNLKKCNFVEYRSWVIVNYVLSTGNRVATMTNLKIKDLNFEDGTILLSKTKNKREQIVPMSTTLSKILLEYLGYRNGEPDDYLFSSIYGGRLTEGALQQSIVKYNQRRGIMKTSVHLFRHTFAKKWILANGDIFRLQKILGHSDLSVVREYVEMFGEDLKQDFHRFNALEQLNPNSGISNIKMKKR